jgi:NADPH:quinone reductase-like Zn-dependent oxidoreductase
MKAIAQEEFGSPDVLRLTEVEKPVVTAEEVLVHVRAASPNPWDWHFMRGLPYISRPQAGWRKPKNKVLGSDMAGEVDAVGDNVTRFGPGDQVYGFVGHGGFAEYVAVPQELLGSKPANLSFEQAATVPLAAMTALQGVRDEGRIQPGERVLIVGASGGVGTFAVQLAKWLGAHVTGVCSSRNVEMVESIGADRVVDYTKEDFTRGSEKYDVIFQVAGKANPSECRRALTPEGRLVLSSGDSSGRFIGPVSRIIKAALLSPFVKQSLRTLSVEPNSEDLQILAELIDAGKVTPVIDKTFSLSDTAEAIRYLETGHASGKVVIAV